MNSAESFLCIPSSINCRYSGTSLSLPSVRNTRCGVRACQLIETRVSHGECVRLESPLESMLYCHMTSSHCQLKSGFSRVNLALVWLSGYFRLTEKSPSHGHGKPVTGDRTSGTVQRFHDRHHEILLCSQSMVFNHF